MSCIECADTIPICKWDIGMCGRDIGMCGWDIGMCVWDLFGMLRYEKYADENWGVCKWVKECADEKFGMHWWERNVWMRS